MGDKLIVRVWNVLVKNKQVKVATIEQENRTESMCEGCSAPCCQGFLRPVLTEEEFKSRKFPTKFLPLPKWLKKEHVKADYIATLAMPKGACSFFDSYNHKCLVYSNCPKSCLAYDCREDQRPEVQSFARERMKVWQEQ